MVRYMIRSLYRVCQPPIGQGAPMPASSNNPWAQHCIFGPRILVTHAAITKSKATFGYSTELPNNDSLQPSGT